MSTSPSKRRHRPHDLLFEPIGNYSDTRMSSNALYGHQIPDLTTPETPKSPGRTPISATKLTPNTTTTSEESIFQSPIRTTVAPHDDGSAKKRRVNNKNIKNNNDNNDNTNNNNDNGAIPLVSPPPPQLDLVHEYLLSPTYARYQSQNTPQSIPQSIPQVNVEEIFPQLSLSSPSPRVAHAFANARNVDTQVQAYAKLAGANWTYYVKSLSVVVGRSNSDNNLENVEGSSVDDVDIDLSPGKIVSRRHAIIRYDPTRGTWAIHVLGRNGIKVDRVSYKVEKDPDSGGIVLNSGSLIDIGGVQMMFVLPNVNPVVAPGVLKLFRHNLPFVNFQGHQGLDFGAIPVLDHSYTYSYPGLTPTQSHYTETSVKSPQRYYLPPTAASTSERIATVATATADLVDIYTNSPKDASVLKGHGQFLNSSPSHPYVVQPGREPSEQRQLRELSESDRSESGSRSTTGGGDRSTENDKTTTNASYGSVSTIEDLSLDEYKDVKPPYSYATMITQAILSNDEEMISLADIYEHIAARYSFYRHSTTGWQNSIRHNLSLNKAFEKVPRRQGEPGKGMKWKITPQHKEEYLLKLSYGELEKRNKGNGNYQRQLHLGKKREVNASKVGTTTEESQLPPNIVFKVERGEKNEPAPVLASPPMLSITPKRLAYNDTFSDQYGLTPSTSAGGHSQSSSMGRLVGSIASATITPNDRSKEVIISTTTISAGASLRSGSPSPTSQGYRISQLEAFTPDRGSNATRESHPISLPTPLHPPHSGGGSNGSQLNKLNLPGPQSISTRTINSTSTSITNNGLPTNSTGQLAPPSSFMPNSSPAPFWRFMHLNSTPVRGLTNGHDSLEDSLAFGYRTSIGGIGGGLGLYNDISPIKYVKPVEKRETSKIEVVQDENLKEKTVKKEEKAEMKEEDEISEHNKTETKPAKTATTGRLGDLRNVDLTRGFRGFHTVDKEDHLSEKELRNKGDKEKDDKSTRKISK